VLNGFAFVGCMILLCSPMREGEGESWSQLVGVTEDWDLMSALSVGKS